MFPPPEPVPPLQQPPVAVVAHPGAERSSSDESPGLVQRAVLGAGGVVARTHHQLRAEDSRIDVLLCQEKGHLKDGDVVVGITG